MPIDLYTELLIWGFFLAVILGAIANKTNFCTMGAVSDWINMGDLNRLRAWVLAMAIAILGVGGLEYLGFVDMSLTASNDTSNPPYRTTNFVFLRHLVGGLLFGIGMTLASGCGNKTLVRLGEGNMKSLMVFFVMAVAASIMLFTSFDYLVFLQWMMPSSIDFADHGIAGQDLGSLLAAVFNLDPTPALLIIPALIIGLAMLIWVLKDAYFRGDRELVFAGLSIGLLVVFVWYLTAGETGQLLLEELDFMDERPYAAGAQSFSFIAPGAHIAQYFYQGLAWSYLSFGAVVVGGVVVGSFLYTIAFRKVRLEWFVSWKDFLAHAVGAVLMGVGGVLGMGCTIGQGITGMSTLALGSFVTVVAIIAGSAGTMKYQYYRMMNED